MLICIKVMCWSGLERAEAQDWHTGWAARALGGFFLLSWECLTFSVSPSWLPSIHCSERTSHVHIVQINPTPTLFVSISLNEKKHKLVLESE